MYSGSAEPPACFSTTSLTYRSASVRWRAATSTTVARFLEREVARVDSTTLSADSKANSTRIAATVFRLRGANGRNEGARCIIVRP